MYTQKEVDEGRVWKWLKCKWCFGKFWGRYTKRYMCKSCKEKFKNLGEFNKWRDGYLTKTQKDRL